MKRLISIIVSLFLLALLWSTLDRQALFDALVGADLTVLSVSMIWLVGLVFLSALRLFVLAKVSGYELELSRGIRATFVANTLNMVLPSKLGDVLKAATLAESGKGRLASAFALGAWEKLVDLAMLFVMAAICTITVGEVSSFTALLAAFAVAGLMVAIVPAFLATPLERLGGKAAKFASSWRDMLLSLRGNVGGLSAILLLSGLIWLGHLFQITLLIYALGGSGDIAFWGAVIARIPIAIVAGLIPLTFAGIGTRDAAIVFLYTPLIGAASAAALGVLFWLRYLVPGLLGLPFLRSFGADVRGHLTHIKNETYR